MSTTVRNTALYLSLFFATGAQAQNLQLNPQVGEVITKYPFFVQLADSGANGTGQTWDFSAFDYDNNAPQVWTYRLPTSDELVDFPQANLAADTDDGQRFYNASADSLAYAGKINDAGPLIYSNLLKEAVYPFTAGEVYTDAAHYIYSSGATTVDVDASVSWEIVGSGTLVTPLATYPSAWKVRTRQHLEFYANGNLIQTVEVWEYDWYTEGIPTSLLSIAYDDYNASVTATVFQSAGIVGLAEETAAATTVFPNPASEAFTIAGAYDRYTLTDGTGRIVRSGSGENVGIGDLPNGQYVLQLYSNGVPSGRTKVVKAG